MQHMQRPTCTNVRIRSTQDAHKIFYAVQQGILQMVTRRLDADERQALRSGCVYAWEERGPHTEITGLGIERFTEGRRWSPSRVRDEFLFYYEKYTPSPDASQTTGSDKLPPRDWDPLVKQTYSVWVETNKGRRKWHLTAYFTQATVDSLGTIDEIEGVGSLSVPDGIFKSTRVAKNRKLDEQSNRAGETSKSQSSTVARTYAPFPNGYSGSQSTQTDSPPGSQSLQMYEPYPNAAYSNYYQPEVQSPQFSMAHPLPSQPPLPSLRSNFPSSYNSGDRSDPPYPEYNRQDSSHRLPLSSTINPVPPRDGSDLYRPNAGPSVAPSMHSPSYNTATPILRTVEAAFNDSRRQPQVVYSSATSPTPQSPVWYGSPHEQYQDRPPPTSRPEPQHSYSLRQTYASYTSPYPIPQTSHPYPNSLPLRITHSSNSSHGGLRASLSPQTDQPNSSLPPLAGEPSSYDETPYEASPSELSGADERRENVGPCRVDLAPLHTLKRSHPYRRDPVDDRTLRLLGPRSS